MSKEYRLEVKNKMETGFNIYGVIMSWMAFSFLKFVM